MRNLLHAPMFAVCLLSLVVGTVALSSGQVATGTPPFGSFGGGPVDTVNLANLNVHVAIPIINKAGRGMPFTYTLSYDTAVWYPTLVSGVQTWQPVANWGWRGQTEVSTGYITYQKTTATVCPNNDNPPPALVPGPIYSNFVYHDSFGVSHPFPLNAGYIPCSDSDPASALATDGSGYTLTTSGPSGNTVTSRSGDVVVPPVLFSYGSGTKADANGNQISVNSSGVFTDTLGTTALTVTGAAPNPLTFTYTGPSGSKAYTMNYTSKNVKTNFACSGVSEYTQNGVYLVSSVNLPDGSQYTFTYEPTPGNSGYVTGRLQTITLPTGGSIQYTYTGTHTITCSDGSAAGLTRDLTPGGTWSYARTGTAPAWTTTVSDPQVPTNQTEIKFEGIYETQRKVYQGSTSGTLLSTTITCYNGNGVSTPSSCATTQITSQILRTTVFKYIPDSAGIQAETDSTYDTFGLINEVDEYGYGTAAVGGLLRKTITTYAALGNGIVDRPATVTIKDVNNAIKAYTAYAYDEVATTATTSTPQHSAVTGSRGNLTTVTAQANGTTNLYRKFTYYDTGTLKTSTDVSTTSTPAGTLTTYNYASVTSSCGNSFATSITEPLTLSRSMAWNCTGGVLTSITDENGKIASAAYTDPYFWRPSSQTDTGGTVTNFYYYLTPTQTESKLTFNNGSSVVDQLTTLDGLGRLSLSQTRQGPATSNYDSVETDYDASGRVSKVTLPYAAANGDTCTGTCPGTTTTYDALNRPLTVSDNNGGTTTYTYTKNDVYKSLSPHPTGENNKDKQLQYDALGRLTSVCEITSSANGGGTCAQNVTKIGYWTQYTFDALGHMTGVTQNAQGTTHQTRTLTYDYLGRLLTESNPENGLTQYVYDTDPGTPGVACSSPTFPGDLVKRYDANGTTTCHHFDALHRLASTYYYGTAGTTPSKHFFYDNNASGGITLTNTKGRLSEAYTCTAGVPSCTGNIIVDEEFSYSARGEPTDVYESTPNSAGYYHVTAAYWDHGGLKSLSNLTGLPSIYYGSDGSGLDGEGRLTKVTASSGTQNPVTAVTYTTSGTAQPIGSITQVAYGSADYDNFSYDTDTRRTTQYKATVGSTPQTVTGDLTWNANGTLGSLVIADQPTPANNQTCIYTYDDLARIASNNCGASIWSQTFTSNGAAYDAFGNLQKAVPSGSTGITFAPTYSATTNRFSSIPGVTVAYDSNGNLKTDNSHTYTWDAENNPITVDSIGLTYDALGRLVETANGGTYTQFVYDPTGYKLGLMHGQTFAEARVPLPGGGRAVYTSSGLSSYWHPDWLGTSRLETTPTRTVSVAKEFAPYGETYPAGASDFTFTGNASPDTAPDLYDFLFRKYSPTQGRWISPDPSGLAAVAPANPQSWNRYAYVGNQPNSAVDPLGLYQDCITNATENCWPGTSPGPGPPPCVWEDCPPPPIPLPIPVIFGPGGPPAGGGSGGGGSRIGGRYPNGETLGLPQGLNLMPMSLADLLGLNPNGPCDFGICAPIGSGFVAEGGGWDDVWHLWHLWDRIKGLIDDTVCVYYVKQCRDDVAANSATCNANQDPMKAEIDAEQCQLQGRTDCSSAGWNNIQCSGFFQDENCKKAFECGLDLTRP